MATAHFEPGGWLSTFWSIQWFAGLIPVAMLGPLVFAVHREGKWPRARVLMCAGLLAGWGCAFLFAQGLAMWAVAKRPRAMAVSADGIWCAPWQETVRWKDVAALDSYDEKMGTGWRTLGVTLLARGGQTPDLMPREYENGALRWGVRLAHGPVFGHGEGEMPCGTRGLNMDSQAAIRVVQEIYFKLGARVEAKYRPRNRCWVEWCLQNKGLDHVCIANMPSDASAKPCLAGVDY